MLNKLRKNLVEDTHSAPADEAIVESFVRPILTRGILPLQALLDNINDPADDTSVIDHAIALSCPLQAGPDVPSA